MIPIKHICSLGNNCHSASMLKRNQWKKESYPFDWIFSNVNLIKHCIDDDFNKFLDQQYYPDKDPKAWQQNHEFYFPFSEDKMFNHHNPLKKDDYAYFQRCVERFRKLCKSTEFKVFFNLQVNHEPINEMFKEKIKKFNIFLKSKIDNNFALICIVQSLGNERNNKFETYSNIHFIELTTTSPSNGIEFLNPEDNKYLDDLIKNVYKFDIEPINKS